VTDRSRVRPTGDVDVRQLDRIRELLGEAAEPAAEHDRHLRANLGSCLDDSQRVVHRRGTVSPVDG